MPTQLKYELPSNEVQRLKALDDSQILLGDSRREYDAIVDLAKQLIDVPVILISMVGKSEQFFKAKIGIDAKCTPREISFCTHTILKEEPMIVLNALTDARFKNNPLVTNAPGIRFYAGAPIVVPDGLVLGTLCAVDTKPKTEFDAKSLENLCNLALITARMIELDTLSAAN